MPKPVSGLDPQARLRAELIALLRGGNAHAPTAFALDGIPLAHINERVEGFPHSLWDLLYHLWFTQDDILDFCRNPAYQTRTWPTAYWPKTEASPDEWAERQAIFLADLDAAIALTDDPTADLFAEFGHAPGYTLLRELLLIADHNAHHLGQIIALRRQLDIWGAQ